MEFFLPMIPPRTTAQQQKTAVVHGKPRRYDPPALAEARAKLTSHLAQHRPQQPMEGPLLLEVQWCFPTRSARQDGKYKTTRPDTDNLNKLLKDCMTRCGYWLDDAQVAAEVIVKCWAKARPGIFVRVSALKEEETIL